MESRPTDWNGGGKQLFIPKRARVSLDLSSLCSSVVSEFAYAATKAVKLMKNTKKKKREELQGERVKLLRARKVWPKLSTSMTFRRKNQTSVIGKAWMTSSWIRQIYRKILKNILLRNLHFGSSRSRSKSAWTSQLKHFSDFVIQTTKEKLM